MNTNHTVNTRQHWLTQFQLRKFSTPNRYGSVWAFDKSDSRTYGPVTTANVGCAFGHFDYNAPNGQVRLTADAYWGEVERTSQPVVNRILERESVAWLQRSDRKAIARFILALYFGSLNQKKQMTQRFPVDIEERRRRGDTCFGCTGSDEECEALFAIVVESCDMLLDPIVTKTWWLSRAHRDNYVISDTPVGVNNEVPCDDGRMNVGLAAANVHLVLPISPSLTLHMCCARFLADVGRAGHVNLEAIHGGIAIVDTAEQTMISNAIQLRGAERQLFGSNQSHISDLEEILARFPEFREPHRCEFE